MDLLLQNCFKRTPLLNFGGCYKENFIWYVHWSSELEMYYIIQVRNYLSKKITKWIYYIYIDDKFRQELNCIVKLDIVDKVKSIRAYWLNWTKKKEVKLEKLTRLDSIHTKTKNIVLVTISIIYRKKRLNLKSKQTTSIMEVIELKNHHQRKRIINRI